MARITRPETPLRRALQEEGRMQKWLAEQVGCDPSQMSDYVRGLHIPAQPTRDRIADVLDRRVDELWPELVESAA